MFLSSWPGAHQCGSGLDNGPAKIRGKTGQFIPPGKCWGDRRTEIVTAAIVGRIDAERARPRIKAREFSSCALG
jgi:hypothetical protein